MSEITLDPKQAAFIDAVRRARGGQQIELSAPAGAGKSFTVNYLCELVANILRCASTGAASVLVDSVTAHSLFCVPVGGVLDPTESIKAYRHRLMVKMNRGVEPTPAQYGALFKKTMWLFPKKKMRVIESANKIVVDESSMIRCDTVDWIDKICRHARKNPTEPFGGMTIIWVGDNGQLPPVVLPKDRMQLKSLGYQEPFGLKQAKIFQPE